MFFRKKILRKIRAKFKNLKEKFNLALQNEKNKYISTLQHDIKTPLLAQIQSLEYILDNFKLKNDLDELLKEILNSNYFLLEIIKNSLFMSNFDRTMPKLEKINLSNEIKKCALRLENLALDKNQNIIIQAPDTINLRADRKMIQKIIHNLITSSLCYGFENSPIELILKEDNNEILFTARNKSVFMTKEKINSLFEEKKSPSDLNLIGMSLNLNLAKKLIYAHNWEIIAKSDENSSTFGFVVKK